VAWGEADRTGPFWVAASGSPSAWLVPPGDPWIYDSSRHTRHNPAPPELHYFPSRSSPAKTQRLALLGNCRWRGGGGGGVQACTRLQSAAGDGVPPSLQIPPHTRILLARSPAPYSPFRRAHILQRHFQVQWRARLSPLRVLRPNTYTQDGWFLQPKRRPARLPRRTIFSRCICRCSRLRARLPLHILLLHTQVSR